MLSDRCVCHASFFNCVHVGTVSEEDTTTQFTLVFPRQHGTPRLFASSRRLTVALQAPLGP